MSIGDAFDLNGNGHGRPQKNSTFPENGNGNGNGNGAERATLAIAQVAPLYDSVPPKVSAGTERIVSYLTEELVAQGHDVTLFAAGDSETSARLVPGCVRSLRLGESGGDPLAHHMVLLERVMREADRFDVIHFHCNYIHFTLTRRLSTPSITTLHGRLDSPDLSTLYREFPDTPVVSISEAQREPLPWVNWRATVPHGLPESFGAERFRSRGYLAFLGPVSPDRRLDRAIEIAHATGKTLRIAAKVDAQDRDYFDDEIRPLLDEPGVEFLGEIAEEEKGRFLGEADALLFPIDRPEPFGLVMIEAMACGTPVIAFRHGSVPEVIQDGVTGYVVGSIQEAVKAVGRIGALDRDTCRAVFEKRFTARRMATDYVNAYRSLFGSPALRPARSAFGPWLTPSRSSC